MSSIGQRIRERRKLLRLTQKALGEVVGVAPGAVSQWETGETEPTRQNIQKLAKALETPESWLEFGPDLPATAQPLVNRISPKKVRNAPVNNLYDLLPSALADELADASIPNLLPASEVPVIATKRVWVVGEVQAGVFKPAVEWEAEDQFEVEVPLKAAFGRLPTFALRVTGPSMDEVFPDGSFVICVRLLDMGPLFKLQNGTFVVVLQKDAAGNIEATVKQYEVDAKGEAWLWPRSSHPEFQSPIRVQDVARAESDEIAVWSVVIADTRMRL